MENEINIEGIDKAELLAALFNRSRQQGMGFLNPNGSKPMTTADAAAVIESLRDGKGWRSYFDYLHGRVMKVDIGGATLEPWGYDRDNGRGAAASVIAAIRAKSAA